MGKRSNFERVERDFYPTPLSAVLPLLRHLQPETRFDEPCVGDGDLAWHLEGFGHKCVSEGDIATGQNVLDVSCVAGDMFITNPPWDRKILHAVIERLPFIAPTWLLFDADWMHTKQSKPYMQMCCKIVSVGRVKWIPDSKMTGKDNCAWYLFDNENNQQTEFYGR